MELIVAEKPRVAEKIAYAICENVSRKKLGAVSYFEGTANGKSVVVAPAVGHIYTLVEKTKVSGYPTFDIGWVPAFEGEKGAAYTKGYVKLLESLGRKADLFTVACDYDLEGCIPHYEKVLVNENGIIRIMDAGKFIESKFLHCKKFRHGEFEVGDLSDEENFIYSANQETFRLELTKIKKIMRRAGEGRILRITTEFGRQIHVSRNHPVFAFTKDGIVVKEASGLSLDDYMPAAMEIKGGETVSEIDLIEEIIKKGSINDYYIYGARDVINMMPYEMAKITNIKRKTCLGWRFFDRMPLWAYLKIEKSREWRKTLKMGVKKSRSRIPVIIPLDRDFGRLIGYYLAEGCIDSSGFLGIYFGPTEDDLVDDVEGIFKALFEKRVIKRRKRKVIGQYWSSITPEIGTKSKIISFLFLEVLGVGRNSHVKRLPKFIFSTPPDFYRSVLGAYLVGDGSAFVDGRDKRLMVSAGSVSKELIANLHLLLLFEGIHSTLTKYKEGKVHYLNVSRIEALEKLMEIGAGEVIKRKKLDLALNEKNRERPAHVLLPNFMIDGCEVDYQTQQNIKHGGPYSRTSLSSMVSKSMLVNSMIDGGIWPLKITKIEEIDYEGYLYDFETENGSFMHGNGIITHNSLIGYNVFRFAYGKKNGARMKFSTLVTGDLREAYAEKGELDYNNAFAGEARHILDWYYGINLSRALMGALKAADRFRIMSIGRVQGPALSILSELELKIKNFVPTPYWEVSVQIKGVEFMHAKGRFGNDAEAQEASNRTGKQGRVESVEKKEQEIYPNPPFDLTSLQVEAYRVFGFPPARTLEIAQSLYEASLISYPRTSSQKLPPKLNLSAIIRKLSENPEYAASANSLLQNKWFNPFQGKKEDPAHPAIHPTGHMGNGNGNSGNNASALNPNEKKLYDLIVRRFLATFAPVAKKERTAVVADSNG